MIRRRSVGHDAVRVAVRGDEHVAGEDRAAARSRRRTGRRPGAGSCVARTPSCRSAPARSAAAASPAKYLPGWSRPPPARRGRRSRRPTRSPRAAARAGRASRSTPDDASAVAGVLELLDVRRRVGELEVAALAELAVDRLVGDEPLDGLVAVEGLAVQRPAGLVAVALDQLARAPLVAGMDDPAVARRRAPAERLRLEERHRRAAGEHSRRGADARVPATDDDDVRGVRQCPTRPIGQRRHRRAPVRPPLEVAVQRRPVVTPSGASYAHAPGGHRQQHPGRE